MPLELEEQYDQVYRYCYWRVGDRETAEDLTQEAFLRYLSQDPAIRRGRSLAYLYTIAKHLCIDFYRARKTLPLDEERPGPDGLEALEAGLAVRQAVARLPEELQEVILLRFANELGIGEIAAFLDISRFAVHRKLGRALRALKTQLGEEELE